MVRYAPAAARSKVVILDETHMLTDEASNALLKSFGRTARSVIFGDGHDAAGRFGGHDSVRRSQHFHFRALTFNEIAGRIEEIARKEDLKIEAAR